MSKKGLNANFFKGLFRPKNPEKYKGKNPPIFRSSFEYKFMTLCDESPRILEWASESTVIPYFLPNDPKRHLYFVDNYVKMMTAEGEIKKFLVEVKPFAQTQPPVAGKRKRQTTLIYESQTFVKNQCKWAAARKYAAEYGMGFLIITEKELRINVK